MAWNDIPRWEKMTSRDLAKEAGFPLDCDAIYVNNCYELSYVPYGELAEMDRESYIRFWRGSVFKMLFQVHYEFLNGCDDVVNDDRLDAYSPTRCGDLVLVDRVDVKWPVKHGY